MDVAFNGFLSQLTDDVKKEKEKEPEKPEKPEILSFKKKGFELEKKDSDDSDEVSWRPHESRPALMVSWWYSCLTPPLPLWQETKKDLPKLSKKKLRRMNRLTVAELKQVTWVYLIKITIKTTLEFIV